MVIILFAGMTLSVGAFLLQYYGFCPTNPALPGAWPVAYAQRRATQAKDEGLPVDVIARLKSYNCVKDVPFKLVPLETEAVTSLTEEEECLICQDEMGREKVTQLTCGHIYHKSCIASWLKRKASCPTCRQAVTKESINGTALAATLCPDVEMGMVKQETSCALDQAACCQNSTQNPSATQAVHNEVPAAPGTKTVEPTTTSPCVV